MVTPLEVVSSTNWVPVEVCQVTAPEPWMTTPLLMAGASFRLI
jgi:hypothetical protein